jgi:hypothetical protein
LGRSSFQDKAASRSSLQWLSNSRAKPILLIAGNPGSICCEEDPCLVECLHAPEGRQLTALHVGFHDQLGIHLVSPRLSGRSDRYVRSPLGAESVDVSPVSPDWLGKRGLLALLLEGQMDEPGPPCWTRRGTQPRPSPPSKVHRHLVRTEFGTASVGTIRAHKMLLTSKIGRDTGCSCKALPPASQLQGLLCLHVLGFRHNNKFGISLRYHFIIVMW